MISFSYSVNGAAKHIRRAPSTVAKDSIGARQGCVNGGGQGIGKAITKSFVLAKAEDVIITGWTKQTLTWAAHDLEIDAAPESRFSTL